MAGARGYQGDRYGGLIQMIGCYGGKVSPSQPDMHFGIGDDITHQNLRLFALTMRERCKRAIHWCGDYSSSHTCNEDTYCQWDNGWDTAPCADLNEVSCKGKQSQGCSWVKK